MKFTTETGSVYEINTDSKQIRRLNGKLDPTPRMGKAGEWRTYHSTYPDPIEVGSQVIIVWGSDVAPLDPDQPGTPTTITSQVVSIEK
jgi:hypothetical protein